MPELRNGDRDRTPSVGSSEYSSSGLEREEVWKCYDRGNGPSYRDTTERRWEGLRRTVSRRAGSSGSRFRSRRVLGQTVGVSVREGGVLKNGVCPGRVGGRDVSEVGQNRPP